MKKYYTLIGLLIIIGVWQLICMSNLISPLLFPPPLKVLTAFKDLWTSDYVLFASLYSIKLNAISYLIAIIISLPLGFILGLFPIVRQIFSKYIDAIRYIPLTAATGIFIAWFGIEDVMKTQFLAFGIFVFLLPTVVQRVDEVEKTYTDMAFTLGATKWQTVWTIYIPSVISRVSDDIRVLVAISWTYLIVAELVNKTDGLGALSFTAARQSRIDKVFAILIIIVIIGLIQDWLFKKLDKVVFPFKYVNRSSN